MDLRINLLKLGYFSKTCLISNLNNSKKIKDIFRGDVSFGDYEILYQIETFNQIWPILIFRG